LPAGVANQIKEDLAMKKTYINVTFSQNVTLCNSVTQFALLCSEVTKALSY